MDKPPKRLLDQVRDTIRLKHYSIRTEKSYISWIRRYIIYHNKRHPKDMGKQEIESFLTHLAVDLNVAASTQNQAFNAILFLYNQVLNKPLDDKINAVRAKKPRRLPVVMTSEEALSVINALSGINQLMAKLLYGCGLRLMECARYAVQYIFEILRLALFSHETERLRNKAFQAEGVVFYFEVLITQFLCCSGLPLVKNLFFSGTIFIKTEGL